MEKRRRIRRKSSFGKRIMVTVLSLAMLIGLFVPGFAVGAEEIIPDGGVVDPAPEELFQSDAAKNLQQRVTLFVLTDPQSDPTAVEEYNALVQEVGTADYLSDAERLELQMNLSTYAAVTVPESDGGTTSDGSLEIAQPYISVKKTFVGLTSSEIPSDFAITVSKDGGSVYTLTMAPDNQYYKGFDNTTMTASWEINGLSNGTYMASKSGFTIDKYDCLATGTPAGILDGAGVTISESSYGTATELDVLNNKNQNTFTVDGQQFFAGALKGNVIVIMDHDPSIAEKNQVAHTLKTMDLSGDWKINSATFYYYVMPAVGTGEEILVTDPEEIKIGSDYVTMQQRPMQHPGRFLFSRPSRMADLVLLTSFCMRFSVIRQLVTILLLSGLKLIGPHCLQTATGSIPLRNWIPGKNMKSRNPVPTDLWHTSHMIRKMLFTGTYKLQTTKSCFRQVS